MKTTSNKTFDAVAYMREQRRRLSEQMTKMTKEEIVAYFNERALKNTVKPNA